jgi:hypothetical protein
VKKFSNNSKPYASWRDNVECQRTHLTIFQDHDPQNTCDGKKPFISSFGTWPSKTTPLIWKSLSCLIKGIPSTVTSQRTNMKNLTPPITESQGWWMCQGTRYIQKYIKLINYLVGYIQYTIRKRWKRNTRCTINIGKKCNIPHMSIETSSNDKKSKLWTGTTSQVSPSVEE